MSEILSRFRITSSAFERPFENTEDKSQPNFVYFLSVEGDDTEKDYFTLLEKYLRKKYPKTPFVICLTPSHSGLSSPDQVLELLEQCADIRKPKIAIKQLSNEFKRKYGKHLDRYFGPDIKVTKTERKRFKSDLESLAIRYQVVDAVRMCGRSANNQNPSDRFVMMVDRDRYSHTSKKHLLQIAHDCLSKGFRFCFSNPCFEIWLYLHVVNIAKMSSTIEQQKMLANEKIDGVTHMARLVKKRCGHGKKIKEAIFLKHYWRNVDRAIANANGLTTKMPALLNKIGTNVGEFVSELKENCVFS